MTLFSFFQTHILCMAIFKESEELGPIEDSRFTAGGGHGFEEAPHRGGFGGSSDKFQAPNNIK